MSQISLRRRCRRLSATRPIVPSTRADADVGIGRLGHQRRALRSPMVSSDYLVLIEGGQRGNRAERSGTAGRAATVDGQARDWQRTLLLRVHRLHFA